MQYRYFFFPRISPHFERKKTTPDGGCQTITRPSRGSGVPFRVNYFPVEACQTFTGTSCCTHHNKIIRARVAWQNPRGPRPQYKFCLLVGSAKRANPTRLIARPRRRLTVNYKTINYVRTVFGIIIYFRCYYYCYYYFFFFFTLYPIRSL